MFLNDETLRGAGGVFRVSTGGPFQEIAAMATIKISSGAPNAAALIFGLGIELVEVTFFIRSACFLVRARTGTSSGKTEVFSVSAVGKKNPDATLHQYLIAALAGPRLSSESF